MAYGLTMRYQAFSSNRRVVSYAPPLFPPLQDTLTMSMTPKYYEQGEVIVQQGTPGN